MPSGQEESLGLALPPASSVTAPTSPRGVLSIGAESWPGAGEDEYHRVADVVALDEIAGRRDRGIEADVRREAVRGVVVLAAAAVVEARPKSSAERWRHRRQIMVGCTLRV